jgi:4-amino-4-deoxy-L-arabinose transferase-like glycosyltransferase
MPGSPMRPHKHLLRIRRAWQDADWHPLHLAHAWGGWLTAAVVLLLLCRLVAMLQLPVAGIAETRDSGLAVQTLVAGTWLVPHLPGSAASSAEPPLAAWAGALSMALFGVDAFAARLPAALASAVTVWVAALFAASINLRCRWLVVPALGASPLFFASAAAAASVAIQAAVVFAAQYCAWRALTAGSRDEGRGWRGRFWACIGIGALANGLATVALAVLPLAAYLLYRRDFLHGAWQLSDRRALFLGLMLCVPWFVEAERAYPGFLRACLVDRHIAKFRTGEEWGYQAATMHGSFPGVIWLFWIGAILPWIGVLRQEGAGMLRQREAAAPAVVYLWFLVLVPLVSLSFSHDVAWSDALPAVPPFAVLVARRLDACSADMRQRTGMALTAGAVAACAAGPWLLRQMA